MSTQAPSTRPSRRRRRPSHAPLVGGAVVIVLLGVLAIRALLGMRAMPPPAEPRIQEISIVQPPPPPPPPPKVEEPPPPEEQVVETPPEPEPAPLPEEPEAPPASEELGLDADGSAGSDGFGLRARKGGRGLIGGGGGNAVIWFGQRLSGELGDALRAALDPAIARRDFSVVADVWVAPDGRLERAELSRGSGDTAIDHALRSALARLQLKVAAAPPPDMPQPVRIRVNARG